MGGLACAPQTGCRSVAGRDRRTAGEAAAFRPPLLTRPSPKAASIRLGQEKLPTHPPGAFYEILPAEAFARPRRSSLLTPPNKARGATGRREGGGRPLQAGLSSPASRARPGPRRSADRDGATQAGGQKRHLAILSRYGATETP